jgi:glycolate oxidase FAD binding subunit
MKPTTIEDLQEIISTHAHIAPCGSGSKTALVYHGDLVIPVSSANLSGVLEYEPQEYTFTALAGTPVAEIERVLAEHNQYLPFDPVLVGAGATLGGTVAAGLSGAGRYRYGGVRDCLLGVKFFDGQGSLVRGGGKVVKNAAGFDLPKFMVGSLGYYGFLVELSFKVMPLPEDFATLRIEYPKLTAGLDALVRLTRQPFEIYALDLETPGNTAVLIVQVGGAADSIKARLGRVIDFLGAAEVETLQGASDRALWLGKREFTWVKPGASLVKVPLTPKRVEELDKALAERGATRQYSSGANLAWIAWQGEIGTLDDILVKLELGGLLILGAPGKVFIGKRTGESFARRIKQALDPQGRYMSAGVY